MCKQNDKKEFNKQLEATILKNLGSALQFFKNQQWKVCYYTLLLYGAIVATQHFFVQNNYIIKAILAILIILVSVLSILLNCKLRDSSIEHRKYINNIYEKNKEQVESYGIPINQETRDDLLNLVFIGSAVLGCVLSFFIVVC